MSNYASDLSPIVLDIETVGLDNAADFLDPIPDAVLDDSPVQASARLVDQEKKAADIAHKRAAQCAANDAAIAKVERLRAERQEALALDWNVGRIAVLGYWIESHGYATWACHDEARERLALTAFWELAHHRTIVGFCIKSFDLRFLIQRSRYLQVPYPNLDLGKYSRQGIEDLYLLLTFNDGVWDKGCMKRTLTAFCRRFGIDVPEDIEGSQVPTLLAAGDWASVVNHCRADLALTVALARRLGVIRQPAPVAVAAEEF